jgi:hypothetical protein
VNWETILFLVLFFVLPIVQQILEGQRRRNQPPPPTEIDPEGFEGLPDPTKRKVRVTVQRGDQTTTKEMDWSQGWGAWPDPAAQTEKATPVAEAEPVRPARVPRIDRAPVEVVLAPEAPPRTRMPEIVVQSKPPTPVTRPVEVVPPRQPMRVQVAAVVSPPPVRPPTVSRLARPRKPVVRPPHLSGLADKRQVRRSLIVAEILAKPLSLRDEL